LSDFTFSHRGTIEYLEALPLTADDFLLHAFPTRRGGMSSGCFAGLNFSIGEGDEAEGVAKNWRLLAESFRIDPSCFVTMQQKHGDRIAVINEYCREIGSNNLGLPAELPDCDALVTSRPGLAIGVKTADCVPLFLVDRAKRVIAAVHAGWRGTALNIAGQVLDVFAARFSSRPGDILAAFGPAVGPCCYEVDGAVFHALSIYGQEGRTSFFRPGATKDRWMLDLTMVNRYQLEERGVPPAQIFSGAYCTACRGDVFYSHRRDRGRTGRHFSFLMLKPDF